MFSQDRNSGTYIEVDIVQQSIRKANSINLIDVLKKYNINLDAFNRRACCPFSFHKMGQEKSASFYYYPDNNSFYCFGCKSGGSVVDFVSLYESVSKYQAALNLINNFEPTILITENSNKLHYKSLLEFSHSIRNFLLKNKDNAQAVVFAEKLCAAFDEINSKYVLDPDGIKNLIIKLKRKLDLFNAI